MSLGGGTHWRGPLLGSGRAYDGLFEDTPLGSIDRVRSRYKVYVETFDYPIASAATFAGSGATLTDINVATAPTNAVTGAAPYLLINPGTKADSGSEIQWNAALSYNSTGLSPAQRFLPPVVSTATLMDNRELFMFWRFGVMSDATTWDGKVIMGWFATDTTLMSNTTGAPTVGTGCGLGFHIGETGVLTYIGQQTAITAATSNTTGVTLGTAPNTLTASTFQWHEVGFRCRWLDASAGTGVASFYLNGRRLATQITSDLPMASTQTYGVTFGIHNGPAQVSDLAIDYVVMGITAAGRTNTSSLIQ